MRLRLAALIALLFAAPAAAATCPTYPYTLTNGQVADANQVMANFNSVLNCIDDNVQPLLTLPLPVADGGTGATAITYLQITNNLSDVGSAATALTNLGALGSGNNLSDVASVVAARANLGVLAIGNNLSDVGSVTTARANLGVTATASDTHYAYRSNNLSDLASVSSARANLNLGGAAVLNVGTAAGTVAAGNDSRFFGPTQNSQSAAYTFIASDAGGEVYHPSADTTARTWTIPANASVAYAVGTKIELVNDCSAGAITLAITSDTLEWFPAGTTGSRTLSACSLAQLTKVTTTEWVLTGVGVS